MFIFDAHLDLAMNALEWNRDLTRPIREIRQRERHLTDKPDRDRGTVCLPELRRGNIGLVVATQIARYAKPKHPLGGWHSPAQAWAMTQGQLAWYRAMEEAGELVQIRDRTGLEKHLGSVPSIGNSEGPEPETSAPLPPIGYILSLEGADSIITLQHLERSVEQGLRAVGPAHYGPGTYAFGTDSEGSIGPRGRELLQEMERLGLILDATHLCDTSFREAMDIFRGPVWASHSNARALTPHNRQFTDDQLKELFRRGAVIGTPLDAWMMIGMDSRADDAADERAEAGADGRSHRLHLPTGWKRAAQRHRHGPRWRVWSRTMPDGLETIADLQKLPEMLVGAATETDIEAVMHGNFIRFLRDVWK
jgi:membrane dipeptidase